MISLEVKGMAELQRKLATLGPKAMKMGAQALKQEANVIKENAFHLCPKGKTGDLRNSLWVQGPEIGLHEAAVTIHAGGGVAAPYALAVHEHLSAYSPPSWRSGKPIHWTFPETGPKFLERPVLDAASKLGELLVRRLDMNTMVR